MPYTNIIFNIHNPDDYFAFRTHYEYLDMLKAYYTCRQRKRNKQSSLDFEINFIDNLYYLMNAINDRTYFINPSKVFVVFDPKVREVWAAQFIDRIIHHLIYNDIGPWFEKRFITNTYSCIKDRGTLAGAQKAYQYAKQITNNFDPRYQAYFAKIDIKNFFNGVNKTILWNIMYPVIGNTYIVGPLVYQNIFNNPTINPILSGKSRITDFDYIPPHKSLFNNQFDIGLPIGNLTSQFYSNVYLNELDQYCKHILKIHYYIRYVDDIIMFDYDPAVLNWYIQNINYFLTIFLKLQLHPDKVHIGLVKDGVSFIGRSLRPFNFGISDRVINNIYYALNNFAKNPTDIRYLCTFQSYLGLLKHSKTFNLRKMICEQVYNVAGVLYDTKNYLYLYI